MKSETILVTGSAGFIGFSIARKLLNEGWNVIGIDNLNDYYSVSLKQKRNDILLQNKKYTFYQKDIAEEESLCEVFQKHPITSICHMAAQAGVRYSLVNPSAYEHANIKGFLSILESARKFNILSVIYASSSSVYGNNGMPKTGFSEDNMVQNQISFYGVTKRTNELMAYTYHHLYGMHCTGLRFFTVYGPWGRPDMAYFMFADKIMKGEMIDVFNNGKMQRDFTYIDDIIGGVYSAIQKNYSYEIFNLGNSHTVELLSFISILEKELGKKAKIRYLPIQPGDLVETFANISHAKEKLNFSPKVDISHGLMQFANWYKNYIQE